MRPDHPRCIAFLAALALGVAAAVTWVRPASAEDSRTEYLIDLLENSGNFRSRVQAAETLGQIASTSTDAKEKETILKALFKASLDSNELVRLMVAAMLGTIGDESALPTLKKLAKDEVSEVKKQAEASIKLIEKVAAAGGDTASMMGLEDVTTTENLPPTFYVGIGTWGDNKAVEFKDLEPKTYIKKTLKTKLGKISAVILQPDGSSSEEVKSEVKKSKLTAYTLTGSVSEIALDEAKNKASAKLQMVVLTVDGNMAMMLSATGAASVESKGKMNDERRKDLVYSAIESAVKGLTDDLWKHLKTEVKAGDGGKGKKGKGKSKGKGKGKKKGA